MTSKCRQPDSAATTVRQQPLTATLSPTRTSRAISGTSMARRVSSPADSIDATVPITSMIPVNMR